MVAYIYIYVYVRIIVTSCSTRLLDGTVFDECLLVVQLLELYLEGAFGHIPVDFAPRRAK